MDRRAFVLGALGVVAASGALVVAAGEAEAAALPVMKPEASGEETRLESDFRPEVDGEAKPDEAQYYYYYRPRRYRRVYYYRPRRRRVWRRRRFRRVYYW
jgi:hypothetical protein